jgi:hypothetical protein
MAARAFQVLVERIGYTRHHQQTLIYRSEMVLPFRVTRTHPNAPKFSDNCPHPNNRITEFGDSVFFWFHSDDQPEKSAFSQSLRDCQREIARTRESATAAEGGTHVYLNRKMMQEFTFLLAEIGITSPALSGE